MSDKAKSLYHELDSIIYDSMFSFININLVVMSLWGSDSSVITAGACLVSTIIYGNQCIVANGMK